MSSVLIVNGSNSNLFQCRLLIWNRIPKGQLRVISRFAKTVVVGSVSCGLSAVLWSSPAQAQDPATSDTGSASSVFQFPPTTADGIVDAVQITRKLDRPGDARKFLAELIQKSGSPELSELRLHRGLAIFIDFNSDVRLQPEARELLKIMQTALPQRSQEELASFLQQLGKNDSAAKRAELELITAGEASVPVLLTGDPATPSGKVAQGILETYARDLRFELLRQLPTSDPSTQIRILNLLQGTSDPELAVRLLRYQAASDDPSVQSAAAAAIQTLSRGRIAGDDKEQALVILLESIESLLRRNGAQAIEIPPAEVSEVPVKPELLQKAEALIEDALAISATDARVLRLQTLLQLASTSPRLAADPTVAAALSQENLLDQLKLSLRLEVPVASVECLRAMLLLDGSGTQQTAAGQILRQALESSDARVRGLAAILVRRGWPVSRKTAVERTLAAAANASVKPEAVVVSPNSERQLLISHLLQDAGFSVKVAATSPEGFDAAASQLNCDLFVLDLATTTWTADSTLANLRADVRTRNTSVIVFGDERESLRASSLESRYGRVWFVAEPLGQRTLPAQVRAMNLPSPVMTTEDRQYLQERSR
ncbi:MAG: hypothetical protein U0996_24680 [Planctomycetaceae bacterium]